MSVDLIDLQLHFADIYKIFFQAFEQEIKMGLSCTHNVDQKTSNLKFIAFFREFENCSSTADSYKENDMEVKMLLNDLKYNLKKTLSVTNKYFYDVCLK